jgi:small subunit ribosomal protein S9
VSDEERREDDASAEGSVDEEAAEPTGGEEPAATEEAQPEAPGQAQPEPAEPAPPEAAEPTGGEEPAAAEEPQPEAAEEPQPEAAEEPQPEPAEEPQPEPAEEPQPEGAEEPQPEPAEEAQPESEAPASEQPPGAELDPIALEPERELSAEERARVEAEAEERARLEAEATAETGEEPVARRKPKVELPAEARIQATGKRKSSVARVILRPGSGSVEINARSLEDYFPRHHHQTTAKQALVTSGYEDAVDVRVRVHGGGVAGQAGAVRHGIARALVEIDPDLRGELKQRGLLTRDARRKERRKAGLKKARKRPQFSKR